MFKQYLAYLRDNPQGYWFKAKFYGWGWTPAKWQGWVSVLVYVLVVVALAFSVRPHHGDDVVIFNFLLLILILTVALIVLCYWKGEKPRWRWGTKK